MNKTAIIDLDSILFAASWGTKISDGNGGYLRDEHGKLIYKDRSEKEIKQSLDFILKEILKDTKSTGYIAYVKGTKTATHRYTAKPDYKSNRPKESPKWWPIAKNHVIENWGAIPVDNIEVDDAVNITRLQLENSFIVAIDKDLLNLEGTHYNWRTKKWITVDNKEACIYFWSDMITGQPGDGITGIPGKGKSYFAKLINNFHYSELRHVIFNEYCEYYGEEQGISEFYKNYTCLKILNNYEGFQIPDIIPYKRVLFNI